MRDNIIKSALLFVTMMAPFWFANVPKPPYAPGTYSAEIVEVGCGEYQTVWRTADGKIFLTAFIGNYTYRQVMVGEAVTSLVGAQYECVALGASGYAYTGIRKANDGSVAFIKVLRDAYGNLFNYNQKIGGFWQTYLTLGRDSLHYWGPGNALSYGSLGLNGGADIPAPVTLGQPPGRKILDFVVLEFATAGMHVIYVVCDDQTLWHYDYGSSVPTQDVGITGVTGVFAVTRACYGITTSDGDIKIWGPFAGYGKTGASDPTNSPVSIKADLIASGAVFPLKKIISSYNTLHVIDANNHLFGRGDNMQGEVGNGEQYSPWQFYNDIIPAPFAWSFNRYQKMKNWVQIPGEWADVWGGQNIAFFFFGKDMFGKIYFWGRNKQDAGGTGQRAGNDDAYADWGCIPAPQQVNPSDVLHAADFTFDPTMVWFPRANAGIDRLIKKSSDSLYGSGSNQPEGTISAYAWSKISGNGTIASPTSSNSLVTGLSGTSLFKLTVTGTGGVQASDTVMVQANVGCTNCTLLSRPYRFH